MKVTQITPGRFHHFHLARQLEKYHFLDKLYTGYPRFKIRNELGISSDKIKTFPWIHAIYMRRSWLGLQRFSSLNKELEWLDRNVLDIHVSRNLNKPTILVALSGSGLHSGRQSKRLGGFYVCDRGSTHIQHQNEVLIQEYAKWNIKFPGIDERVLEKELKEYELADRITIPSKFVKATFISQGVDERKLIQIPYGVNLERFRQQGDPDINKFLILWVGSISFRKGFPYALQAFQQFKHAKKEFLVIGNVTEHIKPFLSTQNLDNVKFIKHVNNEDLPRIYSSAQVFILPSLEEGLAMVQGEALACGCPVIATKNTGAEDLFEDRKEGFIVEFGNSKAICDRLNELSENLKLRSEMSKTGIQTAHKLAGWDNYGKSFAQMLSALDSK